jgi:hypothetical protein
MEYQESELNTLRDEDDGHFDLLMAYVIGIGNYTQVSQDQSEVDVYGDIEIEMDSTINY